MSDSERASLTHLDPDPEADEAPEEFRRLIVFEACDEWFGLPIEWVREVQPLERITRVPNAPAEVVGILNLRGRVLTLFDLAGCLGVTPGTRAMSTAVVLDLGDSELCVGIAVQRIAQVREVSSSAVQPHTREGGVGGLEGVFELDGRVVGLLDLSRVFARSLSEWGIKLELRGSIGAS